MAVCRKCKYRDCKCKSKTPVLSRTAERMAKKNAELRQVVEAAKLSCASCSRQVLRRTMKRYGGELLCPMCFAEAR